MYEGGISPEPHLQSARYQLSIETKSKNTKKSVSI